MVCEGNPIADAVLEAFDKLPAKAKPRRYGNGIQEWVPLSGIVLSRGDHDNATQSLRCVSLGTGMRCLPADKLPTAQGNILHDWHAEVVAIRAFNLFLLYECLELAANNSSEYVQLRSETERTDEDPQPVTLKDDVHIHMYSSEAPCGDASMELIMNAQEDPSPWTMPNDSDSTSGCSLAGRGYFSQLGIVRRKPSRGDAPVSLSKSCSDKLALKQCTSLLSAFTSLIVHPGRAYLDTFTLPTSQISQSGVERAFGLTGRLRALQSPQHSPSNWRGGYHFRPFAVRHTDREFEFSRRSGIHAGSSPGSNITAVWTPWKEEVLIGGVRQGFKQQSSRGASTISRRRLWHLVSMTMTQFSMATTRLLASPRSSYGEIKHDEELSARREVKKTVTSVALSVWQPNIGDDSFKLQELVL